MKYFIEALKLLTRTAAFASIIFGISLLNACSSENVQSAEQSGERVFSVQFRTENGDPTEISKMLIKQAENNGIAFENLSQGDWFQKLWFETTYYDVLGSAVEIRKMDTGNLINVAFSSHTKLGFGLNHTEVKSIRARLISFSESLSARDDFTMIQYFDGQICWTTGVDGERRDCE